MPKRDTEARRIRVLVAAPFGRGGRGGIDRIMDALDAAVVACGEPAELTIVATHGGGSIAKAPLHTAKFLWTLATQQFDLVHLNVSQKGSILRKAVIARFCDWLDIPYVVHVHGSRFHHYWDGAKPQANKRLLRLFSNARRTIVLGSFWRDFLAARIGTHADRLVIIPNASPHPVARAAAPNEPVRVLFLGRVGKRKGTPELVAALTHLFDAPAWVAVIAGDGAIQETRTEVLRLGLSHRVTLPGWVGPEQVARLLAESDVLVLPSFDENLPMSVIEGMGQGLAVVTTPVGAVPDIVRDGETGLLVPPGNVTALADALGRVIADPVLRQALGTAARAFHAEHLDLEVYARRMTAVWREAAGAK